MSSRTEIESLIFLLDDPDPFVKKSVVDRFLDLGEQVIPILDEYRVGSKDSIRNDAINEIMLAITFENLEQEFINYVDGGVRNLTDLEDGVFLLARFNSPTIRIRYYQGKLDLMADSIRDEIRFAVDPINQMRILTHYIFYDEDFRGAKEAYFNPENSFLNSVIDRKTGIPISLAMVALFVARRLDLPFHGVNMPLHFMLKYQNETEQVFIDPYHRGRIVSMNQCAYFLKMNGIKPEGSYFENASASDMLARNLKNLIYSYEKKEDKDRARCLKRLLKYLEIVYGDSTGTPSDTDSPFET